MRKPTRKPPASTDADTEEFDGVHRLEAHIHRRGRKDDSSAMTGVVASLIIAAVIFFIWRALLG